MKQTRAETHNQDIKVKVNTAIVILRLNVLDAQRCDFIHLWMMHTYIHK